MKLATILKDFFLRYGEQGACCASWRGSYEPPVPEALKNAVLEEEKKKTARDSMQPCKPFSRAVSSDHPRRDGYSSALFVLFYYTTAGQHLQGESPLFFALFSQKSHGVSCEKSPGAIRI